MSDATATPKLASGAMALFRCLGGECEDTCCGHWGVWADRDGYERLAARMTSPEEHQQLITAIRVRRDADDPARYAQIVMGDDGRCTLLEPSGECAIHHRYGESLLPNTCAAYPRFISKIGDQYELHGMTSCPEVVRLALLRDDTSNIDMIEVPDEVFGRGIPDREMEPLDDYRRSFYLVRGLMQALLRIGRFPIASRLFFVAFFGDRARDWLRPETEIDPPTLNRLIQTMRQVDVLDELHAQFTAIELAVPFAMSVVHEILARPAKYLARGLRVLLDELRPAYAASPIDGEVEPLWAAFQARRATASPTVSARVERYLARYALDHVTRGWHVVRPSLMQYVMGILARVATIRFLMLSHPLAQPEANASDAELDALFVRVVYTLARTIDHDPTFAEELVASLEAQGMTRLEHAICLLKF